MNRRRSTPRPSRKKFSISSIVRPKTPSGDTSGGVQSGPPGPGVPASKTVKPVAGPISVPHLFLVFFSIMVAGGAMAFHLHVRFEGVRLGYEVSEARREQTRLMLKRRELRLELATLKEPGRIENEARQKLGMEAPGFDRIIPVNQKRRRASVSGGAL